MLIFLMPGCRAQIKILPSHLLLRWLKRVRWFVTRTVPWPMLRCLKRIRQVQQLLWDDLSFLLICVHWPQAVLRSIFSERNGS